MMSDGAVGIRPTANLIRRKKEDWDALPMNAKLRPTFSV